MSGNKDVDPHSGIETTGHEWDGLKELNNPLPRWWLWLFYASVVFSLGYWVLMPAWPGISGYTRGMLGYSQRVEVMKAVETAQAARAETGQGLMKASLEEIEGSPQLLNFAMAAGKSAFGDNCATCHGRGAQGFPGYPNLNDDIWIWGGTLEDIHATIQYGVRSGHEKARYSEMPAFGRDGFLKPEQIDDLVEYVVALSGREADSTAVARAEPTFQKDCATCHGKEGRGDRSQGAPNLTDKEWLYGGERKAIRASIFNSRFGVMPAWNDRLDDMTIRALAVYVHTLGGGEPVHPPEPPLSASSSESGGG